MPDKMLPTNVRMHDKLPVFLKATSITTSDRKLSGVARSAQTTLLDLQSPTCLQFNLFLQAPTTTNT